MGKTPSPGPQPFIELTATRSRSRGPSQQPTSNKDQPDPNSPSAGSVAASHHSSNANDKHLTDRSSDRIFSPSADAPTPDTEAAVDAVMEDGEAQQDEKDDDDDDDIDVKTLAPHHFYPVDGTDLIPYNDSIKPVSAPGVPVFCPTMEDFADFEGYCNSIDQWGMQTGIVKVVPPREWLDSLPPLTGQAAEASGTAIKQVRIRDAITQHFYAAGPGIWRQTNITRTAKQWNMKQWSSMCAEDGQKGPEMERIKKVVEENAHEIGMSHDTGSTPDGVRTRSGRRSGVDKAAPRQSPLSGLKRKRARGTAAVAAAAATAPATPEAANTPLPSIDRAITPVSVAVADEDEPMPSLETVPTSESPDTAKAKASSSRPTSKQLADQTTDAEWTEFDHTLGWLKEAASVGEVAEGPSDKADGEEAENSKGVVAKVPVAADWNPSAAKVIEGEYWRGLSFGKTPMYGADLKGTFFTPATSVWNVGALPNLLTRLRLKKGLPGVTTPYLYVGMWRATFAWHVEDMDLYSINYIHFGAPKQWYSIRQADRVRFESTMRGAFPQDAQLCRHFMRHKSYLASPSFLTSRDIKPLRLVQHAQEFVITYPFGYHSGYNLGFNCAESVNFALESWIEIGRKAGFCKCSEESVHMDIDALLEESEQALLAEKEKKAKERRKRKLAAEKVKDKQSKASARAHRDAEGPPTKRIKLSTKALLLKDLPCMLCPSRVQEDLIPIPEVSEAEGPKSNEIIGHAHRCCASFVPETWVGSKEDLPESQDEFAIIVDEEVKNFDGINKDRWKLKCSVCVLPVLARHGAKIQCTYGSCPRAVHVSCALGAPVLLTPPTGEDDEEDEASAAPKDEPENIASESHVAPTALSTSQHGWFIDLVSSDAADHLDGKKKAAAKAARAKSKAAKAKKIESGSADASRSSDAVPSSDAPQASDANDSNADAAVEGASTDQTAPFEGSLAVPASTDPAPSNEFVAGERLVVLCRTHNPMHRRAEEKRKRDELRDRILALKLGSIIRVKCAGSVFEVLLIEIKDRKHGRIGNGEGTVTVRDGTSAQPSTYKWAKIVWDKSISATPYNPRNDAALSLAALSSAAVDVLGSSSAARGSSHRSGDSSQSKMRVGGPVYREVAPAVASEPLPAHHEGTQQPWQQPKPRHYSGSNVPQRELPDLAPQQRPSLPPIAYSAYPLQAPGTARWGHVSSESADGQTSYRSNNSLPPLQFEQGRLPPRPPMDNYGSSRLPPPDMTYAGSYGQSRSGASPILSHNAADPSTRSFDREAYSVPYHHAPPPSSLQAPPYASLPVQPGAYTHAVYQPRSQHGDHRLLPDLRYRAPHHTHFPYQL